MSATRRNRRRSRSLFRSLLAPGLVDVAEVGVIPVLLGGGLPLPPEPGRKAKLRLVKHRLYEKTGIMLLEYARA